ncbi:MAG: hypothetical protein WA542_00335 [Candidatus Acidiferrum sp.]
MMLTVLPDQIDRRKAAIVAENTVKQASYPEGDPRCEPVLRALMESWIAAGCRFDRWEKANPEQRKILNLETNRWTMIFWSNHKGKPLAILSSAGHVGDRPRRVNPALTGYQAFAAFLLCAAPCFEVGRCERCTRFFWKKRRKAKRRFCERRCSQRQTATEGQRQRVSRQRREKNRSISIAIREFIDRKPATADWKAWVAKRAGVTQKYVTRTVNRGLRGEPDGLRLQKLQRSYLERSTGKNRR